MKKIYLLFAICACAFSCTNADKIVEEAFVPDPTIISEYHELNNDGSIRFKYIFDDNGRISEFIDFANVQSKYTYIFDSNNRLINVSKYNEAGDILINTDIVYKTDGKVLSIGGGTFSYNPDMADYISVDGYIFSEAANNFYISDSSYKENVGEWDTEITFKLLVEGIDGNIAWTCDSYEIFSYPETGTANGGCWYKAATYWNYNNNLLQSIVPAQQGTYFEYDSAINPLYQGATNLSSIARFFDYYSLKYYFNSNLFSNNNMNKLQHEPEDPERYIYNYEFNTYDLPINKIHQIYYLTILESERIVSKYYYQGDVIPE